jgi:hypothetical protein
MGFLDGIKGIIFRETCVRAINYDKRNLEMKFDAEAAGIIQYMITGGSVEDMTIHSENQTLEVTINSMSNGTLALRPPRDVIDSKTVEGTDSDFAAFIDNAEYSDPGEIDPTADTRTILVGFPARSEKIDVIGTTIVATNT